MPRLFLDAGWDVTVTDPPLAYGNFSLYTPYPQIRVKAMFGTHTQKFMEEKKMLYANPEENCRIGLKNFSVLQILWAPLRITFYDHVIPNHQITDVLTFTDKFSCLYYLPELSDFSAENNQYIFIGNTITHDGVNVDTDTWDRPSFIRNNYTGSYNHKDADDARVYQVNAATLLTLGNFFRWLKENGMYDNTRIIIVSDHGTGGDTNLYNDLPKSLRQDVSALNTILMFKDFNAREEFSVSGDFMTNGDTLFFAKQDIGLADINPFTGTVLRQNHDEAVTCVSEGVEAYHKVDREKNSQFPDEILEWYAVHTDIFNPEDWRAIK